MEDCLSFGKTLIIEGVEGELDPILDPVLDKLITKKGKSFRIKLADKEVEYVETFKLYLVTKLPNPHFSPELFARTTVIDFTVTMVGLEAQLLGRVVKMEKAELEIQKRQIQEDITSNAKKMKELEDDLLDRLSNSEGDLLQDTSLIDVLARTKKTVQEVKEKLAVAEETDKRINESREEYRPVATRGSIVYFLVADLSLINPMYQTSLVQFLQLFDFSIKNSEKDASSQKRISNVIEFLTYHVHKYIYRSLYEADKMIFVILLTMRIQLQSGALRKQDFDLLLKGGAALDIASAKPKTFPWIPDMSWLNLLQLEKSHLHQFSDIVSSLQKNGEAWRNWYDQETPETCPLPDNYETKLDKFQKLLLIRCFRTDRTMLGAQDYIKESIGVKYVEPISLDFGKLVVEAGNKTPMIGILSQGSDPSETIISTGKKKKLDVKAISMGQGQEPKAMALIQSGVQTGHWVLLQNCHLGLKFLEDMQMEMSEMEDIHLSFRLWITAEPHPKFPISLLQSSIKFTFEAPQGMRAGLQRSYAWVTQDLLETVSRSEWRSLVYVICFAHSIAQERRKFGALGWNVPYEFNSNDLSASVQFLANHMLFQESVSKKNFISWQTVHYMICEVHYGGRITDDFDRRMWNTYGSEWLTTKVFSSEFEFYTNYKVPQGSDIQQFRSHVDQMSLVDPPEMFGLHSNADITFRTNETNRALSTIIDIQPKEAAGSGGMTTEEIVLASVNDLLIKLPAEFKLLKVKDQLKKMGSMKPMNIFLGQEVERLQKVISLVGRTMKDMKLAIAGTIIMSDTLRVAMNSIFDARAPPNWVKISWPSPTLGLWFLLLQDRTKQLASWLDQGRPSTFWMTGFFNPQGFLTAMRQEVARNHKGWALDDVVLTTNVTTKDKDDIKEPPNEGVYIYGLYMDGASWDKKANALVDSKPKVLFFPMPVVHIGAALSSEKKLDGKVYECPCYKIPSRTGLNYVFTLELRTNPDRPEKWILRGVAVLCSKE